MCFEIQAKRYEFMLQIVEFDFLLVHSLQEVLYTGVRANLLSVLLNVEIRRGFRSVPSRVLESLGYHVLLLVRVQAVERLVGRDRAKNLGVALLQRAHRHIGRPDENANELLDILGQEIVLRKLLQNVCSDLDVPTERSASCWKALVLRGR